MPVFERLLFAICLLAPVAAQASPPPRATAAFTAMAPKVDGELGETAWAKAVPIIFPPSGDQEKPRSEVRFLWAESGVFLSLRATDATPAFGHFKRGEPIYQEDVFEVFIDQVGDHRQYYEIQTAPNGQVFIKNYVLTAPPRLTPEGRLAQEFVTSELWRWDLAPPDGFRVASRFDRKSGVWTLEMFLPSSFVNRRQGGGPMAARAWRVNLVRHDWDKPKNAAGRKVKFMYWAPVLDGHPHLSPTRMGWLELQKR